MSFNQKKALALDELMNIAGLETVPRTSGSRTALMAKWIADNVVTLSSETSVVNIQHFDSEHQDLIKERLLQQLVEDLTSYAHYEVQGNKIKVKLCVLKYVKKGD